MFYEQMGCRILTIRDKFYLLKWHPFYIFIANVVIQKCHFIFIWLNSRAKTLSIKNMKEMELKVKTEMDSVSFFFFSFV